MLSNVNWYQLGSSFYEVGYYKLVLDNYEKILTTQLEIKKIP